MRAMQWTRSALALAALGAWSGAGALVAVEQKEWKVSCVNGALTVKVNQPNSQELDATCTMSQNSAPPFDAKDGIKLVVDDVSGVLTVTFGNLGDVESLSVVRGSRDSPVVNVEGDLASSDKLFFLGFENVNFTSPEDVKLSVPPQLNSLSVVGSNAKGIGFAGNTQIPLERLTLEGEFTQIPRILYEANYSSLIADDKNFQFNPNQQDTSFSIDMDRDQKLSEDFVNNLQANIPDLAKIGVKCESLVCSSSRGSSSSNTGAGGSIETISSTLPPSSTPSRPTNNSTIGSNSSDSSTSNGSEDSGGGSDTVLIVVVVVVALVALVLLFFIVRHCRSRRAAAAANGADENTETLMAKAETPASGAAVKGSFISSDEFLRTFRVEQSDVSLTKSLGTGRLWMGEYQNNKVIIKRVETEVTESFVTKDLMNQARTMASLSHPNIVSLMGVTWLAGTDFAVIAEFLAKGNLKTVLANLDVELDLPAKLQLCLEVAQGLAYLHDPDRNMCMKTLSSRKVLVSSTLACKLNLFECVSAGVKIDHSASASPFGMGEIAWLAPEVLTRSAPMDARKANIFAFGVLVGEVLTRAAPYQTLVDSLGNTLSDLEIVARVKSRRPLSPHELRREYVSAPPSLREAVDACLSYDTMGRPTAEQLVLAVERAIDEARSNSV